MIDNTQCRSTSVSVYEDLQDGSEETVPYCTGEEEPSSPGDPTAVVGAMRSFSHSQLRSYTNDFDDRNVIGRGGFGVVYKGSIYNISIAVKVLSKNGIEALGAKNQMKTEISALRRFQHPNVLSVMGCCEDPICIVYPYMERRSLFRKLHRWKVEEVLTWEQRVSILRDTASGLAFLHSDSPPFVHHDIKSQSKYSA